MPGKVPERWEEYTPFGNSVKGTRFIAFKVPLEERICRRLPSQDMWFTPQDLVSGLKKSGHNLGFVIDLTNTTRYYKHKELEKADIKYLKIHVEGKVIPNKSVRKKFRVAVDNFLRENPDNDLVIGVHCTHGLNRTGYMICRYMIENMNFKSDEAIQEFNKARGHSMERENYLQDLDTLVAGKVEEDGADEEEELGPSNDNSVDKWLGRQYEQERRWPQNGGENRYRRDNGRNRGPSGPGGYRDQWYPEGGNWDQPNQYSAPHRRDNGRGARGYCRDDFSYDRRPRNYNHPGQNRPWNNSSYNSYFNPQVNYRDSENRDYKYRQEMTYNQHPYHREDQYGQHRSNNSSQSSWRFKEPTCERHGRTNWKSQYNHNR